MTDQQARSSVTAALVVIGEEILSGRTGDENIAYIAAYLTRIGIALREFAEPCVQHVDAGAGARGNVQRVGRVRCGGIEQVGLVVHPHAQRHAGDRIAYRLAPAFGIARLALRGTEAARRPSTVTIARPSTACSAIGPSTSLGARTEMSRCWPRRTPTLTVRAATSGSSPPV